MLAGKSKKLQLQFNYISFTTLIIISEDIRELFVYLYAMQQIVETFYESIKLGKIFEKEQVERLY